MSSMDCDMEWLNLVIRGKIGWRKCPSCDADGIGLQSYNDEGDPCKADDPEARRETCTDCDGLAFIELPEMDTNK